MRRALLLLLGLSAITCLEFEVFPSHTYLQGDTQIFLPVLERLDAPGYLSRDLVATHPYVTYTIYDELTLFLHEALGLDFHTALTLQQVFCRFAGVLGIFILVRAAGLGDVFALLIAALVNLGAALPGVCASITEPEPTPHALAFGLVLLAMGLLVQEKPLLAGLAGGLALLYHVPTAAPFWVIVLIAFLFDKRLRKLFRPALSILVVFILLLANLSQLQPGVIEPQPLFAKISSALALLQHLRTSYVWVSTWAGHLIWLYLAIWVCGVWATARMWPRFNRPMRWFIMALPLCGILSVPASDLLLEHLRWSLIPQLQPARALIYTVSLASLVCGMAGFGALRSRRIWEALLWFAFVLAVPILMRPQNTPQLGANARAVSQMADWAERNTWGSSMFLFPDAGRALYPGMFRAESRRALWVDWESGTEMRYFESAGVEWWERWRDTMQPGFSPQRLDALLPLPIDYYVLQRAHKLAGIQPAYQNGEFVVYDATDLRTAATLR